MERKHFHFIFTSNTYIAVLLNRTVHNFEHASHVTMVSDQSLFSTKFLQHYPNNLAQNSCFPLPSRF